MNYALGIEQNAIKNLVGKRKLNCNEVVNGKEIHKVFKVYMYNYEDENDFEEAFILMKNMLSMENEVTKENNVIH
jgi:hypothetical protein